MSRKVVSVLVLLLANVAAAQESIRWKPGISAADGSAGLSSPRPVRWKQKNLLRHHVAIEFLAPPAPGDLDDLRLRGAVVLGALSDRAVTVSVPESFAAGGLNVTWSAAFSPQDKVSPDLGPQLHRGSAKGAHFVVEFYPDVDMNDARSIVLESGLRIVENPDLLPQDLLVQGTAGNIAALAIWDEVEYVFPASINLVRGVPVNACAGPLTAVGLVSQGVPTIGDGWDGPGRNAAALNYAFVSVTEKMPADTARSEIVRAFNEWAKHAKLTFTSTDALSAARTITVLFARGAHGDSYPFDGPGHMLAHTFYPFPLNAEPIAGDMHLDGDENWHMGIDLDLFSVALHETGHALGLGHSDNPSDVMYPYYKRVAGLNTGDIAGILQLYAAQDGSPAPTGVTPTPITPLSIAVQNPPAAVPSASVTLTGTVSGGSGDVQVTWRTASLSGIVFGTRNWTATIPLAAGANTVVITALDALQNTSNTTLVITRQTTPAPNPTPTARNTTIQISQPSASGVYTTAANTVTVGGTASDSSGIDHVSWSTSAGPSGQAYGAATWSASSIPLVSGRNVITVTSFGKGGGTAVQSITVTCSMVVPAGNDTTAPSLSINSPSSTNVSTTAASIVFSGTASDNVGVTGVTWSNSTGVSGVATGTTQWATPEIPLLVGTNLITIRARDAAGNIGWRSAMVTRSK